MNTKYLPLWRLKRGTKFRFYGEQQVYVVGEKRAREVEFVKHDSTDNNVYSCDKFTTVEVL